MFSGLNLAFFSLTRLRLEIEAEAALSHGASRVLSMREDSHFLLTTILWGNVGINVLLTLLSESVMVGIVSFAFSTALITLFGEIIPQAYFSRNALRMAALLTPLLKFYQFVLYPVAKPSALLLDSWLGKESVQFFSEENIKLFIRKHMEGTGNEIDPIEGTGAINFFSLDDRKVAQEGETINPDSLITLKTINERLIFPEFTRTLGDDFVERVNKSGEKWVVFVNENNEPLLVLDANKFIRSEIFGNSNEGIEMHCHLPIVIKDENANLGTLIKKLRIGYDVHSDSPLDLDVILYWTRDNKRIITGADILGRLLKGI